MRLGGAWQVAWLALAACRSMAASGDSPGPTVDTPAVIVHPTPESRAAIRQAVSVALNGAPVTIADDALTDDGVLLIEHARLRDPNGMLVNGRDPGVPERFHLVKSGERCILVQDRTDRRTVLTGAQCAPR